MSAESAPDVDEGLGAVVSLRLATDADLPAVAEVFIAARTAAIPAMPAPIGSAEGIREVWASVSVDDGRVLWVAEAAGDVIGFADVKGDWLDDLYIAPEEQGAGVGTALLEVVKSLRPDGFDLWVFETNEPARAFYRRHGLVDVERTDGSDNQEGAPDIRMRWPGRPD